MVDRNVKQKELVRITGAPVETLRRWRKEGMPHDYVGTHPRYNLEEVRAWRIKTGKLRPSDAGEDGGDPPSAELGAPNEIEVGQRMDVAKMRIAEAKADQEELSLAVQRGELVPRSEALKGWLQRIQLVKQRLLAVGPRKCRQWAAEKDSRKMLDKVNKEMKLVCREFASGFEIAKREMEKPKTIKKRGRGRPKGSKTRTRKGKGKKS